MHAPAPAETKEKTRSHVCAKTRESIVEHVVGKAGRKAGRQQGRK
jgi:hypothetical protein